MGVVAESTARRRGLLPAGHTGPALPVSLPELPVSGGEGQTLKRVAKGLRPARGGAGKVCGGKLRGACRPGQGLAVARAAAPEGDATAGRLGPPG